MKKAVQILIAFIVITIIIIACSKKDSTSDPLPTPTTYTLTTSSSPTNGGTISPASGTFNKGQTVTAIPSTNFQFKNWSGGASGTANPVTITMNSNLSVTAVFEETPKETENLAPGAPNAPYPEHESTISGLTANLFWNCVDPESDPLTYDVYVGKDNPDPSILLASGLTTNTVSYDNLDEGAKYYWKVVAKDDHENTTTSDIWWFKTPVLSGTPTVTTTDISEKTETTAVSGGNVTNDGGATVTERGVCWSTSENPNMDDDSKTTDGTGTGEFTSSLTGLTPNTTYYVRAYATNSTGPGYGDQVEFTTTNGGNSSMGTFTDSRDGQTYATVEIGSQTWMAENLNYQTTNSEWYDNSSENGDKYGRLYIWESALTACPSGWHLPSDSEWTKLSDYLIYNGYGYGGSGTDIGKSMAFTSGWNLGSVPGVVGYDQATNNSSGFSALPGGHFSISGSSGYLGYWVYWWSATEYSSVYAWYRSLSYDTDYLTRDHYHRTKYNGFSVRCVRD